MSDKDTCSATMIPSVSRLKIVPLFRGEPSHIHIPRPSRLAALEQQARTADNAQTQ